MRWKIKNREPKEGDIRHRNIFALFPTVVGEYKVWLEKYQITEEYKALYDFVDIEMNWIEISRRTCDY